ncbi:MAG: hypothetical protein NZ765_11120 [Anaerolineae bacterium]|nr:hypothetical protein [Anaerolineae bacterium]MDW8070402.1 hypothetical protein [Anaerolineae bacterium]
MVEHRTAAWLILTLCVWLALSMACSLGGGDIPTPPGGRIPVSPEAAERLRQNFARALQEASTGGEFRLFVTNEEITSLVALTLQESGQMPLRDPQIWFTAGRVYMTGTFSPFWPVRFESVIVVAALVQGGQIVVQIERAQMGPFPFPQRVLDTSSRSINETLSQMQSDLEVTHLEILEGELQIAGVRRQQPGP